MYAGIMRFCLYIEFLAILCECVCVCGAGNEVVEVGDESVGATFLCAMPNRTLVANSLPARHIHQQYSSSEPPATSSSNVEFNASLSKLHRATALLAAMCMPYRSFPPKKKLKKILYTYCARVA